MKSETDYRCRNYLLQLWENVENSVVYKLLFVLAMGMYGICVGLVFGLILYQLEWKAKIILMAFGFSISVILSPFQYKRFKKKYRDCMEREMLIRKKQAGERNVF